MVVVSKVQLQRFSRETGLFSVRGYAPKFVADLATFALHYVLERAVKYIWFGARRRTEISKPGSNAPTRTQCAVSLCPLSYGVVT